MISFPEHFTVLNYFLRRLAFNFFGYRVNLWSAIFFVQAYELIEISLTPVCETLKWTIDGHENLQDIDSRKLQINIDNGKRDAFLDVRECQDCVYL